MDFDGMSETAIYNAALGYIIGYLKEKPSGRKSNDSTTAHVIEIAEAALDAGKTRRAVHAIANVAMALPQVTPGAPLSEADARTIADFFGVDYGHLPKNLRP